ncbi:SAM-dependent methyltransferase [Nonomuraea candida]|uniref:SAM-dependent methyltransferase n=1 Tax=Nonomuraea candida TaxID=359159 RepID=UPI000694A023|nr:SAM-dependent methyltransferase [Nonomuraea candida]
MPTAADVARPPDSIARIYDYGLGGKDNTQPDRDIFDALAKIDPGLPESVLAHREAVHRGAGLMARLGVRQFIDLGSGLPDANGQNIFDTVSAVQPDARVVYVDVAGVPAAHGRALLTRIEPTLMVQADVREHHKVLRLSFKLLDPDEPVGVIATALMHFWKFQPYAIWVLHSYLRAFHAGGYLAFSHACSDMDPDVREAMVKEYSRSGADLYPRSRADIAGFLDGLVLLRPGLVEASTWRPDPDTPARKVGEAKFLFAVAGFGPYGNECPHDERHTPAAGGAT